MEPDLDGNLSRHVTDFSVFAAAPELSALYPDLQINVLNSSMARVRADATNLESAMEEIRERFVAHHVYVHAVSDEEVLVSDKIDFECEDEDKCQAILAEHALQEVRRIGITITARLSEKTGMNPVKLATKLAEEGITAEFHRILSLKFHDRNSWHIEPSGDQPNVQAFRAWESTQGSPDIIIAVLDDGFDLFHPCMASVNVSDKAKTFVAGDDSVYPFPDQPGSGRIPGRHGTSVASLIFGQTEDQKLGIAPKCTFLPIKFDVTMDSNDLLDHFEYASEHAHVVLLQLWPRSVRRKTSWPNSSVRAANRRTHRVRRKGWERTRHRFCGGKRRDSS